jgi:tellurite resistance protein
MVKVCCVASVGMSGGRFHVASLLSAFTGPINRNTTSTPSRSTDSLQQQQQQQKDQQQKDRQVKTKPDHEHIKTLKVKRQPPVATTAARAAVGVAAAGW